MNYINLLESDLKYGIKQEDIILELLQSYFKCNITKSNIHNSWYDYYYENNYYELKSRKFKINKYPTTMLCKNKIDKAKEVLGKTYFIFNFYDNIGVIEYNTQLFETFDLKKGGRYDRGKVEENLYYYIPIEKLTII